MSNGSVTISVELNGSRQDMKFGVHQMTGCLMGREMTPEGLRGIFQHMLEQRFGKRVTYDASGMYQPNTPLGGDHTGRHGHGIKPVSDTALRVNELVGSGDPKRNRRSDSNKDDPKGKKDNGINLPVNTDTYI